MGVADVVPELSGLYIWDKDSVFRNYHGDGGDLPAVGVRVGTLLILLNTDYTGGRINICHDDGPIGISIDHSDEKQSRHGSRPGHPYSFVPARRDGLEFIASHDGASYDIFPVRKGRRLALSYDLYSTTYNGPPLYRELVEPYTRAIRGLSDDLVELGRRLGTCPEYSYKHTVFFKLKKVYHPFRNAFLELSAEDRTPVNAAQRLQDNIFSGYFLRAYLVKIDVTDIPTPDKLPRLGYIIRQAMRLDGASATQFKHKVIANIDHASELEKEELAESLERSITCMMLVLEKAAGTAEPSA